MEPLFWLQICDRTGRPVTSPFRPYKHRHGTLEVPIIEAALAVLQTKPIGVFRTKARVLAEVETALQTAIQDLKNETIPIAGGGR